MSAELKDRILRAVPIESYIGRYVRLKRSGHSFKGLCPFHKEKTPSFTISPDKGLFYCFGCGKGGDIFRFVMEQEKLAFPQVLELLARYAGIELHSGAKKSQDQESKLAELNGRIMQTFRDFLQSPKALIYKDYLLKRGLTEESIDFFQLGASPDRWEWLGEIYSGYQKELLQLGLLRQKDASRPPYDFFRQRIIFPILAVDNKRVVGFGGRALPGHDKEAKYINSSESLLFKKSRLLYGLSQNLSELRSRQEALIVEGYLDVIGLWQSDKAYACAPLGTALSPEHLHSLTRYVKAVTLLFDGDPSGLRAARRAVGLSLKQPELKCAVCLLPPGRDPFDLCTTGSSVQIDDLLEHKIDAARFFLMETMLPDAFQQYCRAHPSEANQGPLAFGNLAQRYYAGKIPDALPQAMEKRAALDKLYENLMDFTRDTDRRLLLEGAARLFKLDPLELQREWTQRYGSRKRRAQEYENKQQSAGLATTNKQEHSLYSPAAPIPQLSRNWDRLINCERSLLLELFLKPGAIENFYDRLSRLEFEDQHSEFLWRHLEGRYFVGNIWTPDKLTDLDLPEDTYEIFSGLVMRRQMELSYKTESEGANKALPTEAIEDYLLKHKILQHEKYIDEIGAYISVADPVEKSKLIKEKGELIGELNKLKALWRSKAQQAFL